MEPHSSCWCQNSLLWVSTNQQTAQGIFPDMSRTYPIALPNCCIAGERKNGQLEAMKQRKRKWDTYGCRMTHFVTRPSICIESIHACISFCQKINKTQRNFCYFNRPAIERAAENLYGIMATLSKDWKELED